MQLDPDQRVSMRPGSETQKVADPTFHFDEDPDPDSSFQIKAQNHEKVLK
jgi:hypothetical protein